MVSLHLKWRYKGPLPPSRGRGCSKASNQANWFPLVTLNDQPKKKKETIKQSCLVICKKKAYLNELSFTITIKLCPV